MKLLLFSAACIIAITRLCRDRDGASESPPLTDLITSFRKDGFGNINKDPQRPYDLFNFYYPPGQTSVRFH